MKQLKAVVLEKKGSRVTILAADGSFQKVRYPKPVEVGSEIEIAEVRQHQPSWRVAASIAAVFLLALMGSMSWNFYQATTAVAMISVDINPRLQLTIDKKGRVLQSESLNPDAERVLAGLPLKGEPWNQALSQIIEQSVTLHYLNPNHSWVLVGYSPVRSQNVAPKGVTPDDIAQRIESAAQAKGMEPKIAVYQLGVEEQTKAQESGLTLGEYALMNTAQEAGIQADANTVKNTDERVKLLEQPQVQNQMNKENRIKGKALKDNETSVESTNPESKADHNENNNYNNSGNNNLDTNTGKKSGNKPEGGVSQPSGTSQGNDKQEIRQGQQEQDKADGKEAGNQGKSTKSENGEDNTQRGFSQKREQRSSDTSDSGKTFKNFSSLFKIFTY